MEGGEFCCCQCSVAMSDEPMLLACGHGVCRGCLRMFINKATEDLVRDIACPLCGKKTEFRKVCEADVSDLWLSTNWNMCIAGLVIEENSDTVETFRVAPEDCCLRNCAVPECARKAVVFCETCGCDYCAECSEEVHLVNEEAKTHVRKDFSERVEKRNLCLEHNYEYIAYCAACRVPLCLICLEDVSEHVGHADALALIPDVKIDTKSSVETMRKLADDIRLRMQFLGKFKDKLIKEKEEKLEEFQRSLGNFLSLERTHSTFITEKFDTAMTKIEEAAERRTVEFNIANGLICSLAPICDLTKKIPYSQSIGAIEMYKVIVDGLNRYLRMPETQVYPYPKLNVVIDRDILQFHKEFDKFLQYGFVARAPNVSMSFQRSTSAQLVVHVPKCVVPDPSSRVEYRYEIARGFASKIMNKNIATDASNTRPITLSPEEIIKVRVSYVVQGEERGYSAVSLFTWLGESTFSNYSGVFSVESSFRDNQVISEDNHTVQTSRYTGYVLCDMPLIDDVTNLIFLVNSQAGLFLGLKSFNNARPQVAIRLGRPQTQPPPGKVINISQLPAHQPFLVGLIVDRKNCKLSLWIDKKTFPIDAPIDPEAKYFPFIVPGSGTTVTLMSA